MGMRMRLDMWIEEQILRWLPTSPQRVGMHTIMRLQPRFLLRCATPIPIHASHSSQADDTTHEQNH